MLSVQEHNTNINNDTMQGDYEASTKGIQSKDHSCTLHYSATYVEGHAKPGGDTSDPDRSSSSEPLQPPEKCLQRPLYHHFGSWFANPLQGQLNAFQGQFHPFAVNYRLQYSPPLNMFPQMYPHDRRFQDFQYFVVIDFEATCDKDKNPNPQEIIEFPAVIVNSLTGQLEACFQTYVRPTCNQQLSDFCKDLTGIQQIQVDRGVTLGEALIRHDKWLENKGIKNSNFAVVTWSNWDCRVMLESECRLKNIRKPQYFNRWINLRVPFYEVFGGVRCNLKEAVEKAGLSWQGRPHCGLDDAKNTARLLTVLMHKGFKFSITNSLACNQPTTLADDNTFESKPTQEKPASVMPQPQKVWTPLVHYHPYCYCRIRSSKGMIRKPGPKQGSIFFGCGNWTSARGARCQYFEWASP